MPIQFAAELVYINIWKIFYASCDDKSYKRLKKVVSNSESSSHFVSMFNSYSFGRSKQIFLKIGLFGK